MDEKQQILMVDTDGPNQEEHPNDSSRDLENEQEIGIRGEVARVTFRNSESGYSVIQLAVEDVQEKITVVGNCLNYAVGSHIVVHGSYILHPKFGKQLHANRADEIQPSTEAGIEKYLGSGLIKGIGPKTAARLVKAFGSETLEILYREPERAAKLPGISQKKALLIGANLRTHKERQEVDRFFLEHDLTLGLIKRLYERYGFASIGRVQNDPYILSREVRGIGFKTADSVALKLGFEPDSPHRLKAGLVYALEKAQDEGHCFLPGQELRSRAVQLLEIEDRYDFSSHLNDLCKEGYLVLDEENVYLKALYDAEVFVARFIANRSGPFEKPDISLDDAERCLALAGEALGLTFSYEQADAVRKATQYPLLVVTGGPGCGKTTVIRALARTFAEADKNLALAAPTGKAAQRMAQVCEQPAQTIHRLLRFDPRSGEFHFGPNRPLCIDEDENEEVDAIIIDETSMLDVMLAKDLFSSIPKHATLILVGDKDQLPSVGPGKVFGDLISLPDLQVVNLSRLFRRSEESAITQAAHRINSGIIPQLPSPGQVDRSETDAYFIERQDPSEAAALIERLVVEQLPEKFDLKLDEITVLTPTNRGPLGAIELNRGIQQRVQSKNSDLRRLDLYDSEIRIGDRVCQRVNNYRLGFCGVFNGDIGIVTDINEEEGSAQIDLWDGRLVTYDRKALGQLSLSYAMTIHRSQGSEMPCVVMCLHSSHTIMLERQLFYTGVTRAKQLLVLVGSKKALGMASKRTRMRRRFCDLRQRITALL